MQATWLLCLAVAFAPAAGCMEGTRATDAAAPDGPAEPAVEDGVRLEGNVIDESLLPVEGAEVSIGDNLRLTDDLGRFSFEALAAGQTTLRAFKIGFQPLERSFEVIVGQPLNLTLALAAAPSAAPHVRTIQENGFLACSLAGSIYLDENPCPDALQAGQRDRFQVPFNRSGLQDVLVELVWTSNIPGGAGAAIGNLALQLTDPTGRTVLGARGYQYIRLSSPPGPLLVAGEAQAEPTANARVWAAPQSLYGEPGGVAYQQQISLYFSFAYGRLFGPDETFRP